MRETGFAFPALDSQRVFRTLLTALSEPGRILPLEASCAPPHGVDPTCAAVILSLCDSDTPLWLGPSFAAAEDYFRFHTGAPSAPADEALFLLARATERPPLPALRVGEPEYPEKSATLILCAHSLADGEGWTITGPGVKGPRRFRPDPIDSDFLVERRAMRPRFPLGVDVLFVAPGLVAALPRSALVEV